MSLERDVVVDELAELRRRAYGPGADIGADPLAQARLAELEEAERAAHAAIAEAVAEQHRPSSPAGVGLPLAPSALFAGSTHADDGGDAAELAPTGDAADDDSAGDGAAVTVEDAADGSRTLRSRLGDRLPWLVAAVAAIVAVVAITVLVVADVARPRPELSFSVNDAPPEAERPTLDAGMLDYWDIPRTALEYRGTLGRIDIWTMGGGENLACIIFSSEGDFWWRNCALKPLTPTGELVTRANMIPADSTSPAVPPGSYIRFAWEGDVVNVYIVRVDEDA